MLFSGTHAIQACTKGISPNLYRLVVENRGWQLPNSCWSAGFQWTHPENYLPLQNMGVVELWQRYGDSHNT